MIFYYCDTGFSWFKHASKIFGLGGWILVFLKLITDISMLPVENQNIETPLLKISFLYNVYIVCMNSKSNQM